MKKLVFTPNIPFDMKDWEKLPLKKVFAGINCIMAITDSGEVVQKVTDPDCAARTQYWTRIEQIAISKLIQGAAIGLVSDGTCLISKRPVRRLCEDRNVDFEHINNTVKSWTDIVEVAASDAFFALDSSGRVHYVNTCKPCYDDYKDTQTWENVRHIVTGTQNSVFGITNDGRILCAGSNCSRPGFKESLSAYSAADIYPTGSECEDLYIAQQNGTVTSLNGNFSHKISDAPHEGGARILDGCFCYEVFALTQDKTVEKISCSQMESVFDKKHKIGSFAVGTHDYSAPFVMALCQL